MYTAKHLRIAIAIAIAAFSIVSVSPAVAQGNGKAKGKAQTTAEAQRQRPTLQLRPSSSGSAQRSTSGATRLPDRRDARDDDDRWEDRRDSAGRDGGWDDILWGNDDGRRRDVPPGWCQGRGNPHNTPENCGYGNDRRGDYDDDREYGYGGYRSYAEAHTAFHRALDREYSARAAQRRSDPIYQLRLRSEKAADHQRWHERTGTRH